MGVEPPGLLLDARLVEGVPVAVEVFAAHVQHRLRPFYRPAHAAALHPVLDVMPARPLYHPRRYRVALLQILLVDAIIYSKKGTSLLTKNKKAPHYVHCIFILNVMLLC